MSESNNNVGPTGQIVIGIIFLIVGIGVMFLGMNEVETARKKAAAGDWPRISGVVLKADVRKVRDAGPNTEKNWEPDVSYSYEVDGRQYIGDTYTFTSLSHKGRSKVGARKLIEKYKEGGKIMVRVDPADPTSSVIVVHKQIPFMSYMFPIFGGVAVLAGLGLGGSGVKKKMAGG